MFHATSRTFNVATHLTSNHYSLHLRSHYIAVCRVGTTISHHHISKHMFHITQTQSTSYTIPYPQLFHTTPTFNVTAYFTSHYIPHRITPHQIPHSRITPHLDFTSTWPPHLTSQHIASFSTSDVTLQSHSTLHITTIPQHHWHFISHRNFTHLALWQHFHIPGHHIPHRDIFHITNFAFNQSHHVWNCNIQRRTTFHIHRHHITP